METRGPWIVSSNKKCTQHFYDSLQLKIVFALVMERQWNASTRRCILTRLFNWFVFFNISTGGQMILIFVCKSLKTFYFHFHTIIYIHTFKVFLRKACQRSFSSVKVFPLTKHGKWWFLKISCHNLHQLVFQAPKVTKSSNSKQFFFRQRGTFSFAKFLILTWFILRHKVLYGTYAQMMIKVLWSCNSLFTLLHHWYSLSEVIYQIFMFWSQLVRV